AEAQRDQLGAAGGRIVHNGSIVGDGAGTGAQSVGDFVIRLGDGADNIDRHHQMLGGRVFIHDPRAAEGVDGGGKDFLIPGDGQDDHKMGRVNLPVCSGHRHGHGGIIVDGYATTLEHIGDTKGGVGVAVAVGFAKELEPVRVETAWIVDGR